MSQITIDLETTVYNKEGVKKKCGSASPHYPTNDIVMAGWTHGDGTISTVDYRDEGANDDFLLAVSTADIIVGQNIGFDYMYLLNKTPYAVPDTPPLLWDTMIVHYLITGQMDKYPSLDHICEYYDMPVKNDKIKEYWKSGMNTEDIPVGELREYLEHDVRVTEAIYQRQLEDVTEMGIRRLVYDELRARLATLMMEYNGMAFSYKIAEELIEEAAKDLVTAKSEALAAMNSATGGNIPLSELNPLSNPQLRALLFGGDIEWTIRDGKKDENGEYILYKSGADKGMIRLFKIPCSYTCDAVVEPEAHWNTPSGLVSLTDSVLNSIIDTKKVPAVIEHLLQSVSRVRKLTKEISTYLIGYRDMRWDDGLIHPTFNHTETPTGRLSCKNPNIQNLSKKGT